jgi:hypothetical protein
MSWLADNAKTLYVLLAIIAGGLVVAWRFNQQPKFLLYAAGALVALALLWLAVNTLPSDPKQLEDNVLAMANAFVEGKVDELFTHVSKEFNYKGMTRDRLYELAQRSKRDNRVSDVKISSFKIDEISRGNKLAKTRFRVSAWGAGSDQPYIFVTQADFVLEGEQWKLKTMRFYNPFVNQDQEIDLPGIR